MKKLLALLIGLCLFNYAEAQESLPQTRIIVKLKNERLGDNLTTSFLKFEAKNIHDLGLVYKLKAIRSINQKDVFVLTFNHTSTLDKIIEDYLLTGDFEYVEPDYLGNGFNTNPQPVKPNDFYYKYQYHHYNDGSFKQLETHPAVAGADIKSYQAWDITTGNEAVVLAVFDTGLKMDHTEINGRLWTNPAEEDNKQDDNGDGYIDDLHGWNFIDNNNDPTDDQGHGTAVAGMAMANANNNIGIAGVDWKCKVMVLKVLGNERSYYSSSLAEAIYYAANNGAHVANMSLGSAGSSKAVEEAVNYALEKGMLIVAAMGNDDSDNPFYPAAYKNTLAVGATHPDDVRVSKTTEDWGSNFGDHIDVVAPGSVILGMSHTSNITYNRLFSGTSMASPMVAGLACLLKGQDMSRTPQVIAGIIKETAKDLTGDTSEDTKGWDLYYGHGRIDAFEAVTYGLEPFQKVKIGDIFPNPASKDKGIITLPLFENLSDTYNLTITDANGKVWGEQTINFNGLNVQIILGREIGEGVYFFTFSGTDKTFTKKVVFY